MPNSTKVLELTEFVEKAPLSGIKPTLSFGGGGDKGEEPEPVPEGQRVYVDNKEDAPKGVYVLTGKDEGLYYDMNQLNEEEHGDAITDVFNDLLAQQTEMLSEEGGQKAKEATHKLQSDLLGMVEEAFKNHKDAEKHEALSDEKIEASETYLKMRVSRGGKDDFDSPEFKALDAVGSKEADLNYKIRNDVKAQLEDTSTPEGKAYVDKKREIEESPRNKRLSKLRQKLGNALIHSFKSKGFKVDDMEFNIDPDLTYAGADDWEQKSIIKVQNAFRNFHANLGNEVATFQEAWRNLYSDYERNPEKSYIGTVMEVLDTNDIAEYMNNTFHANPKVFQGLSSGDRKAEIHAIGNFIHESLHSINAKKRMSNLMAHITDKDRDWSQEAKIRTSYGVKLDPSLVRQKALENTKVLFEEAPVELLSKAIIGDKYYSDLKGRDVYEDSEFTEGKGSREEHPFDGYRDSIPHVARWALGQSQGSPSKARSLLGEMRTLATGEGAKNLQRMNELSVSFGTYLDDYAKQAPMDVGVGEEGEIKVIDDGYHTQGSVGFAASSANTKDNFKLRPRPTTMEGWGGQRSTSIKDAKPTHDANGTISQEAHLDIMHLLYGKG